jgi:hypothetical protein
MKQLLFLIFTLIFFLPLQAQQIAVKSFRSLSNDLDARTSYPKEDKNGEKAALIKIVTTETGFEFDAGVIGIVASVQKTSEIWLYVPRGSKVITIKHPKLGLLRNYVYPQSIEASEVYEMVLTTGKVITTIEEQTIESQWLIITTEPAGADVYINDQPAGKTPYQNELPVGKYTWRVSKELYLPEAGVAELLAGGEKQIMKVLMRPNFGELYITSVPENKAKVTLNGIFTGKVTPCKLQLIPTGEHNISVSLDMYETTNQRITLSAGENKQVVITMKPTFAEVTVSSLPEADIYINGKMRAKASWQGRLNPGVYTFEAKHENYNTALEKSAVNIGQPLNIELSPTPKTGDLKIISTPFEATIRIEGKELGKTPLTLKNQLIGDYIVELSMPDFTTLFEKATIVQGTTSQISVTLQSEIKTNITSEPPLSDLFIDNKPVGKTPYSGTLSIGDHNLRIEKNGQKVDKNVQVIPGETLNFFLAISKSEHRNTLETKNIDDLYILASMYLKNKDPENAAKTYQSIIDRGSGSVNDYYKMGRAYFDAKNWSKADAAFAKVCLMSPDFEPSYLFRARIYSNLDPDTQEGLAKPYYEKLIEKAKIDQVKYLKDILEAYNYLGYFYLVTKDYCKSLFYWNEIIALDPINENAQNAFKDLKPECPEFRQSN